METGRGRNSSPSLPLAHFAYRHCTLVFYFRAPPLLLGIGFASRWWPCEKTRRTGRLTTFRRLQRAERMGTGRSDQTMPCYNEPQHPRRNRSTELPSRLGSAAWPRRHRYQPGDRQNLPRCMNHRSWCPTRLIAYPSSRRLSNLEESNWFPEFRQIDRMTDGRVSGVVGNRCRIDGSNRSDGG